MSRSGARWVAPPDWPQPPEGWRPPPDWQPDPSWPPPPGEWRWWELPAPGPWRRLRAVAALAGSTMAVLIVGSTLLPSAPWVPTWLVFTLFGLVFPLFGSVVIQGAIDQNGAMFPRRSFFEIRRERPSWQRPPQRIPGAPPKVWMCVGVLIFVLFFVGGSGMFGNLGQPVIGHGRYYANDHGNLTQLSKAGYDHQAALSQRWFAGGSAIFLLAVTGLTWRDLPRAKGGD